MFDLLFENACLPDGSIRNIAVAEGRIAAVGQEKRPAAKRTVDLKGDVYLSVGWIDGHLCPLAWHTGCLRHFTAGAGAG